MLKIKRPIKNEIAIINAHKDDLDKTIKQLAEQYGDDIPFDVFLEAKLKNEEKLKQALKENKEFQTQ